MPSGKTHCSLNLFLLPVALFGGYLGLGWGCGEGLIFAGVYLLCSTIFSPDMDLVTNRAGGRWGRLCFLWWPYALLSRHRGLSHVPVLGTLSRIMYLLVVVLCLGILGFALWHNAIDGSTFGVAWSAYLDLVAEVWEYLLPAAREGAAGRYGLLVAAALGVLLPDLLHVLLDRVW